ncbi:Netrin-1 [Xyrichtys novacula]|uniref:Zona pellucida sperm-binding protein 3 n=1 Tax=Xyrichtys novacula TaxID=13765 RepID=A0AAV1HJQ9_XYRNO|nr:Netrin-1 [Xyrichtys novacula]
MFLISVFFFSLRLIESSLCYTYQTKPLFLSFTDLAALEANSLTKTNNPDSHSANHELKKTFVLKCHKDSVEVVMKAHLFHPELPVEPEYLRLGPVGPEVQHHCRAKVSENGDYIIKAPLNDCGSHMKFTPSALLYINLLVYSPPGGMMEAQEAAVPVQCEYRRRYTVSSGALRPTWSPLITTQHELLTLDFQLRLMTDDWSSERNSSVYSLGETVNIEASVDHHHHHHHLPLRLFVNSCVATLSPDVNSYPRYLFIDHQGCFTDSQLHGSSSRFLPRVQDKILHIQLHSFLFHQDHRRTIFITCYLEAEPISNKDPEKKACSYINGRWRSVDGDDGVCQSCSSGAESNHRRALRSQTQQGQTGAASQTFHDLQKETSLGPVTFLTAADSAFVAFKDVFSIIIIFDRLIKVPSPAWQIHQKRRPSVAKSAHILRAGSGCPDTCCASLHEQEDRQEQKEGEGGSLERTWLDDMMNLPFSPPPFTSLFPVFLLLLLFLPPSPVSSSLSHTPLSWTSPHDPCYHLDGRPRHCLSEFINAAYGVPVNASHSLHGPDYDGNITTLTDLHNPHNLTCWMAHGDPNTGEWVLTLPLGRRFEITYISLQFCQQGEPSDPISISILKSMDHGRTWRPMQHYSNDCLRDFGLPSQTVAQSRHQETEPLCSDPRPLQKQRGGMVLAFSTLDGRPSSPDFDHSHTLQDWVTATDIRIVFHQVSKDAKESTLERKEEVRWRDSAEADRGTGLSRWRANHKGGDKLNVENTLAFFDGEVKNSDTRGRSKVDKHGRKSHSRGSGPDEEGHNVTSKEGGDGFTLDILTSSKKGGKSKGRGRKKENNHWLPCPSGGCNWSVEGQGRGHKGRELRKRRNNNNSKQSSRDSQVAPHFAFMTAVRAPLALSDLQVGGRCKCNGHASRCRRDDTGRAVCMCEHHTAGPDCDVCEDFYCDRPWHRATPTHPNPCVACECNGHTNKCRFSMEVFQQSGRRSGGVCQKCRHHTAGRHCQYCQNGYTRDNSKPMTHRKACQPCQCHRLGAVGRWCNQTSGQCLCREGVTGLRCNRCAPGYKLGESSLRPCIRIQEVAPTPVYQPQYSIGEEMNGQEVY